MLVAVAVPMMQCAAHLLARNLGGPVEIRVVERVILRHRFRDRVAIHGGRRRIHQPFDAVGETGFQHVERSAHIHLKGGPRKIPAMQQPQCRKMEDAINSPHCLMQNIAAENVAPVGADRDSGIAQGRCQVLMAAARKIVIDADLSHILLEQLIHKMRADEARPSNHQQSFPSQLHFSSPKLHLPGSRM